MMKIKDLVSCVEIVLGIDKMWSYVETKKNKVQAIARCDTCGKFVSGRESKVMSPNAIIHLCSNCYIKDMSNSNYIKRIY